MKKKSILYIFIFIIGLCLIDNVNAGSKATCTYKYTTSDENIVRSFSLIVSKSTSEKVSVKLNVFRPPNSRTTFHPKDEPGFFVMENDTLYCPDTVYLLTKKNSNHFSLSNNPAELSDDKKATLTYVLTNPEREGSTKTYDIKKEGQTLYPCKAGGFSASETAKSQANGYKQKANQLSGDSLVELQGNLRIFSKSIPNALNMYCEVDTKAFEEATKTLEEANNIIAKKIAGSNATDSLKESSETIQNEISDDIQKTNEIVASKKKQITIREGNILNCEELLDKDLKDVIKWVLKIVRIAVPILLIVLVTIDFSSAVISQDQDSIKKATSKAIKRGIAALAFFFVPLFVNVMLDWLLKYSPITVTKTNAAGETVKVEMRDITCEEVLKGDSDI